MVCEYPSIRNVSATETLLLLPEHCLGLINRTKTALLVGGLLPLGGTIVLPAQSKVQSKKSEDPTSVGSSDLINVNICVKAIMVSYLLLPNALSIVAHLGTLLVLITLAKWSTLNRRVREL